MMMGDPVDWLTGEMPALNRGGGHTFPEEILLQSRGTSGPDFASFPSSSCGLMWCGVIVIVFANFGQFTSYTAHCWKTDICLLLSVL